jgi:AcrR family transcriptional regulator
MIEYTAALDELEGTPAALLDAAEELFAQHGFEGASVREITHRAKANLGAITYHFGSKAALFEAVVMRAQSGLLAVIAAAAQGPTRPIETLEQIVRAHFGFLNDHPRFRRLILQVLLRDAKLPEAAANYLRRGMAIVSSVVAQGQLTGEIRAGDPRLLSLAVMAQPLMLNVVRPILRRGPALDLDDPAVRALLLDNAIQFIRRGLAPREAGE